jgi:hypothetical protein
MLVDRVIVDAVFWQVLEMLLAVRISVPVRVVCVVDLLMLETLVELVTDPLVPRLPDEYTEIPSEVNKTAGW